MHQMCLLPASIYCKMSLLAVLMSLINNKYICVCVLHVRDCTIIQSCMTLYFNIAASVSPRYTSLGGTFRGCIGDVYISQGDSEPKGLLLAQAVEGNNVDFHTCSI